MISDEAKRWHDKRHLEGLKILAEKLNIFRKEGSHTDVTFVVEGKEFPCHKVILAAASPYFNAMFNSGMKESAQSSIELNDVNHDIFEQLLEYAYNGKLDISENAVEELLVASDLFQIENLKSDCEDVLIEKIFEANENSLKYLLFAVTYNLTSFFEFQLEKAAKAFDCYSETCSDELLQSLDLETLIKLIKDDQLQADNEDDVYKFVKRWINLDVEKNGPGIEKILPHLRLAFCTESCLNDEIVKDIKLANTACQKQLEKQLKEVKAFQKVPDIHQHEVVTPLCQERDGYTVNRMLFIAGGSECISPEYCRSSRVFPNDEVYYRTPSHPTNECPEFRIDENTERYWGGETVYDSAVCFSKVENVIFTGGILSDGEPVDTCIAKWLNNEEPQKTVKRLLGRMSQGRHLHSAVLFDTAVYIFGGRTSTGITNKAEKLQLVNDTEGNLNSCISEPVNAMAVAAWSTMSVLFDNKVYILGGSGDLGILSTNQVFNTKHRHKSWTLKADMPTACCDAAAVRYNDSIFVVGGRERVCMKYTPSTDAWCTLKGPEHQHGHAPAVVWCGKIVVGGGLVDSDHTSIDEGPEPWAEPDYVSENLGVSKKIEEYDPEKDVWVDWGFQLPEALFKHRFFNMPWKFQ